MDVKKSISLKIEETIERFLRFIIRYFRTLFTIVGSPLSPQVILNQIDAASPRFVRPLTFLAVGAFAFSLLISVYPMGLWGMFDLIWFVDDIKITLRENWAQAISITGMVTVGMPVIFAVTGLASLSGRLLFRNVQVRRKWFEANAYAFGFQSILFLVILSLDSLFYLFIGVFRFLEPESVEVFNASPVAMVVLLSLVFVTLVWPFLFIGSSYSCLRQYEQVASRYRLRTEALAYYLVTLYVYAGAASALPYLDETYFKPEKAKADLFIDEFRFGKFCPVDDSVGLELELVFDNALSEDLIIDTRDSEFEFELQIPGQENETLRILDTVTLEIDYPATPNGLIKIGRHSYEPFAIRLRLDDATDFYCEVISAEEKMQVASDAAETSHLYLSISAFSLSVEDDVETSQFVDIEDLGELLRGKDEMGQILCTG